MREIKFRVWDGTEMIYDVTVGKFGTFYVNPGYEGNGLDPNDSASLTPFNTKYHEDTPLMQYTGLRDKSGVEIYEGDIVRLIQAKRHYTVEFHEFGYKLIHADPKLQRMPWGPIHRVQELDFTSEVIGNIYQNPELCQH